MLDDRNHRAQPGGEYQYLQIATENQNLLKIGGGNSTHSKLTVTMSNYQDDQGRRNRSKSKSRKVKPQKKWRKTTIEDPGTEHPEDLHRGIGNL